MTRLLSTSLLAAATLIGAPTLALAQDGMGGGQMQGGQMQDEGHDEHAEDGEHGEAAGDTHEAFEHGMEMAQQGWRELRNMEFNEDNREKALELVGMIQEGLITSKNAVPGMPMTEKAKAAYGDDTAKFHSELRRGLIYTLGVALKLEEAVNANDAEAAKQALTDLGAAQQRGHQQFRGGRGGPGEGRGQGQGQRRRGGGGGGNGGGMNGGGNGGGMNGGGGGMNGGA